MFVTAKRGFLVHLRPDDLASSLGEAGGTPVDLAAVEAASKQFEQWLNLRADPDTSRVTTVDDFYRPRYLYQLTAEGEAAEVALAAYDGRWAHNRASGGAKSERYPAPWAFPIAARDVHQRPANTLRCHRASVPVPACPARLGVGWSESGAKDEITMSLAREGLTAVWWGGGGGRAGPGRPGSAGRPGWSGRLLWGCGR